MRRCASFAAILIFMLAGLLGGSSALADAPTLAVSVNAVGSPVKSGDPVTFQVSWSCSSTASNCDNAVLSVPLPTTSDGDPTTYYSATASTGGFAPTPTNSGGTLRWTFVSPLPAGSSGQVTFSVVAPNYKTTNGATVNPVATFAADGATSATATGSATITSAPDMMVDKRRLGSSTNPAVGTDVTYQIVAAHRSSLNPTSGQMERSPDNGTWAVDNVVVVDTLPAGATFVSATGGGVYDPATHTVTWPAWSENGGYYLAPTYQLVVNYPSSAFDTSSTVTNVATMTANPYRAPGTTITAQGSVSHGFAAANATGLIAKAPPFTSPRPTSRSAMAQWDINLRNLGNVPLKVDVTDSLPCAFTSPTDGSTDCATPAITNVAFLLNRGSVGSYTVNYVTNLGNSGALTLSSVTDLGTTKRPLTSTTEWITKFTITGDLPSGNAAVSVLGTVRPDLPTSAPEGTPYVRAGVPLTSPLYVENCLSPASRLTLPDGTPLTASMSAQCGYVTIKPPAPLIGGWKYSSNSVQGIGDRVTFDFQFTNFDSDANFYPIIADLLPVGLKVDPASVRTNLVKNYLPDSTMKVEAIDDYNGTGRQLLRISWPGAPGIPPSVGGYQHVTIDAVVQPGAAIGTGTNTALYFDAKYRNYQNASNPSNCGVPVPPLRDTQDLSGLGDTAAFGCQSSAPYTVVASGGLAATKQVKGSYDAEYIDAPGTGLTAAGGAASYRVDVTNAGNVDETNLIAYDVLPRPGDTGVGPAANDSRGSQFTPTLTGPVTVPSAPDAVVWYSTSTNPCRGEVYSAGGQTASAPDGCTDDWTTTLPDDPATVTAVRVDYGALIWAPGDVHPFVVPMTAPANATGTAWNSVALAGKRVDNNSWLLPVEPERVGLKIANPAIAIVKSINGDDANTAPGVSVTAGSDLAVTFEVTNTGDVALSDVVLTDDTIATSAINCPATELAVGASMTCTATVQAPPAGQLHTNTATVTAHGPAQADGSPPQSVTATDVAHATSAPETTTPPTETSPPTTSTPPSTTPPSTSPPSSTSPSTPPQTTASPSAPADPSTPTGPAPTHPASPTPLSPPLAQTGVAADDLGRIAIGLLLAGAITLAATRRRQH